MTTIATEEDLLEAHELLVETLIDHLGDQRNNIDRNLHEVMEILTEFVPKILRVPLPAPGPREIHTGLYGDVEQELIGRFCDGPHQALQIDAPAVDVVGAIWNALVKAVERAQYIAGLREFADALEANPDVPLPTHGGTNRGTAINWLLFDVADRPDKYRDQKTQATNIVRGLGGKWNKEPGLYFGFARQFGGLHVSVSVNRAAVCERVVTGTHEVTKTVPDPEAPLVEIVELVEDIDWSCEPLLAEDKPDPAAVS